MPLSGSPQLAPLPEPRLCPSPPLRKRRHGLAALSSQLFPSGVQMTGELLADLERWVQLTSKLSAQNATVLKGR